MNNNGNNKHTIDCTACQQRFSAKMPKIEILNGGHSSVITGVHEQTVKCPKCGQAFLWCITSASRISWGVTPIAEEYRRRLEGTDIITGLM
jgi:transcription elongation factor Elf1